jgi:diadenosine tetraphosphatase ApaH/serine/threonine PP2A family protein phosphatase
MNIYGHDGLWNGVNDLFDLLPIAAVVDGRIFAVHGGLSPKIWLIEQISCIYRFQEIDDGPIGDLTWSDPSEGSRFMANLRGKGYCFGPKQSEAFLLNNRLGQQNVSQTDPRHGFIARSHQMMREGYQWAHADRLVTVWSAPNYAYREKNKATVMEVTPSQMGGKVEFRYFREDSRSSEKPAEAYIEYFA